jgi:hypothetical protein
MLGRTGSSTLNCQDDHQGFLLRQNGPQGPDDCLLQLLTENHPWVVL